jgi:hypothetical protein
MTAAVAEGAATSGADAGTSGVAADRVAIAPRIRRSSPRR